MNDPATRIEARGLTRSFGGQLAVDRVTLRVGSGEIYGLVGPDGAGKTTTMRMLAGLLNPTAGNVRLLGVDPFGGDGSFRESLGYMPQQYSLYGDLTVDENLAFFREMFCLDQAAFERRRARLLALTRLEPFGSRRADALSGGMYKKLALSCALLHEPKVLLLDEPTNGVDPVGRREFWDLLHDFLAEGMAILLATSYMDEAARCHRVGLLYEGRLLEEGAPAELIATFPHPVFRVEGDRRRIGEIAEQSDDLLAYTPAGSVLRVVARRGRESRVLSALARAGGRVSPTEPTFEDLFLACVREQRQGAEAHR
jgi:drug efflux transport system ATP-binding protein